MRVAVDARMEFTSLITKASYKKMRLSVSFKIYLTSKSTAVQVF